MESIETTSLATSSATPPIMGRKPYPQALHDISEDKDRAERKKEEGTHVTVSGSPWYHGIHIYISGEEQMETRFQE